MGPSVSFVLVHLGVLSFLVFYLSFLFVCIMFVTQKSLYKKIKFIIRKAKVKVSLN